MKTRCCSAAKAARPDLAASWSARFQRQRMAFKSSPKAGPRSGHFRRHWAGSAPDGCKGSVCVNSGFLIGLSWQLARQVMADCLEREGLALRKATARSGTGCFPASATGKSPSPSSTAPGAARCPLGKKTCRRNCLMRRMMRPLLFKCPLSAGSKGGEPTSAAKIISNI